MTYGKPGAALASLILLLFVFAPVTQNWEAKPEDGFPFSYYPMFAKERGATEHVYHVIGLDGRGSSYDLPYQLAGSGGFNQVRRQIRKHARGGGGERLIEKVARRVAGRTEHPYDKLVELRLVRDTYTTEDYLLKGHRAPARQKIHVTHQLTKDDTTK